MFTRARASGALQHVLEEPAPRRAILQAQAQSHVLERLLWHRPRDVVAGATGQGDVDETIVELEASSASAAPSCYTGSKFSETVKLKGDTFDAALSSCTSSKSSETVYLNVDSDTGSLGWTPFLACD